MPQVLRDAGFPWLKTAKDNFNTDTSRNATCSTARCFLLFLSSLAEVVIQDAAALAIQFPERITHPIYQLDILRSKDFEDYMDEMKIHLEQSKSPWDNSFEQFNMGLNAKLSGIQTNLSGCRSIHERNSSLLTQISAESNQAVLRETLSREFNMLRSIFGDAASVLADRMTTGQGIPVRQEAQARGNVAGSSDHFPSSTSVLSPTSPTYPGFGYHLPNVRSATELWNVWYGLGKYKNKPIPGGVDALESQRSNDWRRGYAKQHTQMFSRYRMSIEYMKEESKLLVNQKLFFELMDKLFRQSKACAITPFERKLNERYRKRKAETAALSKIA